MDIVEDLVGGAFGRILLPEYVLVETLTVLAARRDLAAAVEMGQALLSAAEVDAVACSPLFVEAMGLFEAQDPPRWSFVDATIVAVARLAGADHVATFDRDFEGIEGIRVVPDAG